MQRATLNRKQQLAEWICCEKVLSSMLGTMNRYRTLRTGQLLLKVIANALGAFVASLVALLAASAKISDTRDTSDIAPSGGVLNYRTGKLDEGTDPVGWYERD
ncbi:MAG: hypothetical protein ABW140_11540 [Candidatus Sedimenticola sp. 6PFRAG1]